LKFFSIPWCITIHDSRTDPTVDLAFRSYCEIIIK